MTSQPYTYRVLEVLRVIDGDTVDMRIDLGFGLSAAFRFRLIGVDAPEVYGGGASTAGQEAAEFAANWLADRVGALVVRTQKGHPSTVGIGTGAFGRWLAAVIGPEGESLSDALRAGGHAA